MYNLSVKHPTVAFSQSPFPHLMLGDLVDRSTAAELQGALADVVRQAPRKVADRADKQYSMRIQPVIEGSVDVPGFEALHPKVYAIVRALLAGPVLGICERFAEVKYGDYTVDVGVYGFEQGDFVSMHTDKPEKLLTLVAYFNSGWPTRSGGAFAFHSADGGVDHLHYPEFATAVIFAPGEKSLHSVQEVTNHQPDSEHPRLTIQMELY